MGANHQKEIEFLCNIAQPDFGYITNFGKAHLEGFGGVEGVIKGKSEMYHYLGQNDKMVFVNLEDSVQVERTQKLKTYTFGINKSNSNVNITDVKANPFVEISFSNNHINSHLIGLYNASNISAAICIGKYFDVMEIDIKNAIESYIPENNRSQLLHKNTNEIILDAYNANPSSMEVAIENFIQLDKSNKIAILGDMFELGSDSLIEHKNIVNLLLNDEKTICYFIGNDFYHNKMEKNNFNFYETFESFSEVLKENKLEHKMILIKGSRGMALERTLEYLL
jgi:UDP-N-acetylmuramoyl-tripeptide--D-alanyl-D-alanine ligase